jgi:hypothetical protein
MASKSVMLTSTFVAIAAVPALAQQKRIAKWTLNHFPCKCVLFRLNLKVVVICCVFIASLEDAAKIIAFKRNK